MRLLAPPLSQARMFPSAASLMDPSTAHHEPVSGRSVIPRRLPPVPRVPSLRRASSASTISSSPETSVLSLSLSSSGSSSPATSLGSLSPHKSPASSLAALERPSRPLPRIPYRSPAAQLIVCRSCLNCITTSDSLLAPSAVPPGSRAFRGFFGKASLFTEVYSVNSSPARVQLMATGAHTMQEIMCAKCSAYLGWKIVKAHERMEKWKEGKWLMELENLWLASSSDIFDYGFEEAVEYDHERQGQRKMPRELSRKPRISRVPTLQAAPEEYPKDATTMVRNAREKGLGIEFAGSVNRHLQSGDRCYSQSAQNFAKNSGSAIHLPMTVAF